MDRLNNALKQGVLLALITLTIWVFRVQLQSYVKTIQDLPPPTMPAPVHLQPEGEPVIGVTAHPQPARIPIATVSPVGVIEPHVTSTPLATPTPENTLSPTTYEAFVKTVVQIELQRERAYLAQLRHYFAQFHAVSDQAEALQTHPEIASDKVWRNQLRIHAEEIGQSLAKMKQTKPPARLITLQRLILQQGASLHQGIHALDPAVTQYRASDYREAKQYFAQARRLAERANHELTQLETTG